ncbi:MAG: GNAT family N-acetyltransferase [Candidatus Aminicenantes bacterium]|nr:GNAT family N-acetyltransferase [Candidatus Aminicenantes bacterium]NIM82879.1 GNAT family N-acetyltransferase [Candidatus Aminicenantes bacterium]NIN22255.1 GNAT family N-acetyltransferase [Candidatus Aminicenantes bacterium]NIN46023.1 GNAT family N-acetyltransferase [Candidatus Aminicenantes bacterium]NIN88859.1 GNAT family N-acetyltransferase [Candidatus Aminicenantes bacterium]
MKKTETLKDGAKLTIRTLRSTDIDKLMEFYRSLPYEDRKYLKIDVTNRSLVETRIKAVEEGKAVRIIALRDNDIIAIGVLELGIDDWHRSQGEMRVVVSREYQHKGLGMIMIRELYLLAAEHKLEKIVAKMMRPQINARKMCRKLGFREELFIPDYVKDMDEKEQDLVIMTCDMNDLWNELEFIYHDTDWRRCR